MKDNKLYSYICEKCEKRKLHELIYLQSLTDIDIHNMELIDSYVFDKQVIPKEKDLDFMYYNKNDIFSRAKSDILNIIFEESDVKNLYKIHIEHLISFPEENYENSLNILFKIIPLFKFDKYDAYYTKKKANNFLLNNPIIISKTYSNSNKKQYFLITFLENDYPQCFSYDDEIHYKLEMLPFTKDEVKEILEYIRDRNLNPNDSYKLYITNEPILKDGSDIVISEDYAILITFVPTNDFKNVCQNILIKNSSLAKMFVNYIESYIPAKCLSDKETTFFINNLISTYLTE